MPIAGGEVLTRRQAFRPWIERRAVDIIQPDCTKCGGLTESRRIAWMAYDHNVQVVPHGWNTAVGLAADLQFSAAMPVARYVEYLTPCAYIDEITTEPFRLDDKGLSDDPDPPRPGHRDRRRQAEAVLPGADDLPLIGSDTAGRLAAISPSPAGPPSARARCRASRSRSPCSK